VESLDADDLVRGRGGAVVVAVVELAAPDHVRADVVVEDGQLRIGRALGVDDRLERLVLDLNEVGRISRQLPRPRRDRDHRLADVPDPPDRERVVLHVPAGRRRDLEEGVGLLRNLLAGQDPVDAVELERLRRVDRADHGVRVGRTDEVHVRHAMPLDVVDEHPLALHEALVLLARDVRPRPAALFLALLDEDRAFRRDGGLAHPRAASLIASTMFT
jgi:hypothetical protein